MTFNGKTHTLEKRSSGFYLSFVGRRRSKRQEDSGRPGRPCSAAFPISFTLQYAARPRHRPLGCRVLNLDNCMHRKPFERTNLTAVSQKIISFPKRVGLWGVSSAMTWDKNNSSPLCCLLKLASYLYILWKWPGLVTGENEPENLNSNLIPTVRIER